MVQLKIDTATALGPLEVEVIGARGERIGKKLILSSLRRGGAVDAAPGDYTIVATRPSGEQLVTPATVGPNGGNATIEMAGRSPREFLTEAANVGLAYAPLSDGTDDFRFISLASPRAANTAARSMGALLGNLIGTEKFSLSLADGEATGSPVRSTDYRLACWRFIDKRWQIDSPPHRRVSDDYLQMSLDDRKAPLALSLQDQEGFGPIVIVPPLWGGTDVTFLAAGVAMGEGADRESNPSAVRVPVALAVPRDPGLLDLLVGLNAPVLPNARAIWDVGRAGDPETALLQLANKYDDAAAAVLGALFLARFAPERIPLGWLQNLNRILPDVADTWLLLAWTRVAQGDGDQRWSMTITEQLRRATTCRCTYFSRTRLQLSRLSLRYGPQPRARQEDVATPRRARTGDYLDFAADAGGLEAFWGYSPTRPGMEPSYPIAEPTGPIISMRRGKFLGTE